MSHSLHSFDKEEWVDKQARSFTNWVNKKLKKRKLSINSVLTDLEGAMIIQLLEILSQVSIGVRYIRVPKNIYQRRENNRIALDFCERLGIKLVGITSQTLLEKTNINLELGLIWTIILKYTIAKAASSNELGVLNWVNKEIGSKIAEPIQNLDEDFTNGKAFLALVDKKKPGIVDWKKVGDDPAENFRYLKDTTETIGQPITVFPDSSPEEIREVVKKIYERDADDSTHLANAKDELLTWAQDTVKEEEKVTDLSSSFADGTAFLDLYDGVYGTNEGSKLKSSAPKENYSSAKSLFEDRGIDFFLDPEDAVDGFDERSTLVQVAEIHNKVPRPDSTLLNYARSKGVNAASLSQVDVGDLAQKVGNKRKGSDVWGIALKNSILVANLDSPHGDDWLLKWVNEQIKSKELHVDDWTADSWKNGEPFVALFDAKFPNKIDYAALTEKNYAKADELWKSVELDFDATDSSSSEKIKSEAKKIYEFVGSEADIGEGDLLLAWVNEKTGLDLKNFDWKDEEPILKLYDGIYGGNEGASKFVKDDAKANLEAAYPLYASKGIKLILDPKDVQTGISWKSNLLQASEIYHSSAPPKEEPEEVVVERQIDLEDLPLEEDVGVDEDGLTSWVNTRLAQREMRVDNIKYDLTSNKLINLLEIVAEIPIGIHFDRNPATRAEEVENFRKALEFGQKIGVDVAGITPEQLANRVKFPELVWNIIMRSTISNAGLNSPNGCRALVLWADEKCKPFGVPVTNLDSSFQDGRAFLGLYYSKFPSSTIEIPIPSDDPESNFLIAQDKYNSKGYQFMLTYEGAQDKEIVKDEVVRVYSWIADGKTQERIAKDVLLDWVKETTKKEDINDWKTSFEDGATWIEMFDAVNETNEHQPIIKQGSVSDNLGSAKDLWVGDGYNFILNPENVSERSNLLQASELYMAQSKIGKKQKEQKKRKDEIEEGRKLGFERATFKNYVRYETHFSWIIYIYGSIPELGNWDKSKAVRMNYEGIESWSVNLDIKYKVGEPFEFSYRYFIKDYKEVYDEETDEAHVIKFDDYQPDTNIIIDDMYRNRIMLGHYDSSFNWGSKSKKQWKASPLLNTSNLDKGKIRVFLLSYAPKVNIGETLKIVINRSGREIELDGSEDFPNFHATFDIDASEYPITYQYSTVNSEGQIVQKEHDTRRNNCSAKDFKYIRIDNWIIHLK